MSQYTDTGNTLSTNYSNLLKAVQYYLDKDYDKSAEALEDVDSKMKMDSAPFTKVYEALSDQLSSRVEKGAFEDGMNAYGNGNYTEAIKQFQKCLETNKDNDEAMYYLAYAYRKNGDDEKADEYFKKIVDDYPDSDFYTRAKNQLPDNQEE